MQIARARAAQIAQGARTRGGDRRRQLIDATVAAIAEHGLSGLTLAKVAGRAGLTAASVNFHFTSKEVLLRETLGDLAAAFDGAVRDAAAAGSADSGDAGAGLLAVTDVLLEPEVSAPEKVAVWYAFVSESRARAEYQRVCGDLDRAYFRTVRALFERVLAEGVLAEGHLVEGRGRPIDVDAVTHGLLGLLESLWQEILFEGETYDRTAARRRCRAYLASLCPWRFDMPAPEPRETERPAPIGQAVTLPAWCYENSEFFALEKQYLILPSWQIVCHANDLPKPGDYATFEMLDERAFVIRGKDGQPRAFHNVCRHRAHAVVMGGRGRCPRTLVCPYHGWTYDLDGTLKGVPGAQGFAALDRSEYGLKALDLEVFMGFVFVRFRSEGPGVAERLAPYAAEMAHYRMDEMVALDEMWSESIEVDWKNAMDNYLEDYHFPNGHPGLAALMERGYDREVAPGGVARLSHRMKEKPRRRWSPRHYRKLLPACEHLPEEQRRRWTYVSLFPCVHFDLYADKMDFFQMLPAGPGRTLLRGRTYGLPDASREMRAARYLSGRINRAVQHEDNKLTLSVQGGLRSSGYETGLLSDKEVAVKGFHDWVRAKLPASAFERRGG